MQSCGTLGTAPHVEPVLRLADVLCVILAGDDRLTEKLRSDDLVPLGSRIRIRLALEPATSEELRACLDHLLEAAGNTALMTEELKKRSATSPSKTLDPDEHGRRADHGGRQARAA